ncbi:MAG: hypothetical protein FWF19_00200 [Euryarchaeota archaeon]|nr:hypothetical protein [Euryarchaeota archaeon]
MNTDIQFDSFSLYHESQSLVRKHLLVQIIVFICIIVGWWGFIQQILFQIPFGTNPASDIEVIIIWIVSGWILPAIIIATRLEIEVTPSELRFQYKPFHVSAHIIPRSSILHVQKEVYRPFARFFGWGIRYRDGVVAYTVSGDEGVYIVHQTTMGAEKKILLGSQRAAELEQVLSKSEKIVHCLI